MKLGSNCNLYNAVYLPGKIEFRQVKEKFPFITKETTHDHWVEFMEFFTDQICNNREGVELPLSMGWMLIGAFPSKDNGFKDKRRYCEELYDMKHFRVQERDGFESRILYTTSFSKKKAIAPTFFGFKPMDGVRAKGTAAFVNDWKRYVVIPNTRFMDGAMRKLNGARKARSYKLKTHDEFGD